MNRCATPPVVICPESLAIHYLLKAHNYLLDLVAPTETMFYGVKTLKFAYHFRPDSFSRLSLPPGSGSQ